MTASLSGTAPSLLDLDLSAGDGAPDRSNLPSSKTDSRLRFERDSISLDAEVGLHLMVIHPQSICMSCCYRGWSGISKDRSLSSGLSLA
jgi:hypothetical protein